MNKKAQASSTNVEAINLSSLSKSEDSVEIGEILKKEEELTKSPTKSPSKASPVKARAISTIVAPEKKEDQLKRLAQPKVHGKVSKKRVVVDEINRQYGAPKIYQYSKTDKQRICFEEEDFERYVKRTFKSLKGWDK